MKKKDFLAIPLVCALLVGCSSKAQKEQELRENTYALNLNTVATEMLAGAALSESICGNTAELWNLAIYDKNSSKLYKFSKDTNDDGKIDFNDILSNYYAEEAVISSVDAIKDNKKKVEDLMKDLSNPPEKYTTCYGTVSDLYKTYTKFTTMALAPTGNYQDYSTNYKKYDEEFMANYDLVKTQLPDVSNISTSK